MIAAVLDASALLALLLNESGAENVRAVLADAAMGAVNLSEVVGQFARNGAAEADIRQVIEPLPFERIAFDERLAFAAGLLLPATRSAGLSFGDRACLALASRLGVRAVTADRTWEGNREIGADRGRADTMNRCGRRICPASGAPALATSRPGEGLPAADRECAGRVAGTVIRFDARETRPTGPAERRP